MIYKMYVPPIFKFRCVLYSGAPAYKLHPLVLLEREALRPCFGFPKFIANNVLYLETHVTSLMCRFRLLMVQTFLKMYELAIKLQIIFISQSIIFFFNFWPWFHTPQVVLIQTLVGFLGVWLCESPPIGSERENLQIIFDDIYPDNAKHLSYNILNGLLQNNLLELRINTVIATDASQTEEKSGIRIFSYAFDWSFSLRLSHYIQFFLAEFLALRKVHS